MREAGFFLKPRHCRHAVLFTSAPLFYGPTGRHPCQAFTCLLASPPFLFEDNFVAGLQDIFEAKIMFKRALGLKIACLRPDGVAAHMARRVKPVGTTPTTASTADPSMLCRPRWR